MSWHWDAEARRRRRFEVVARLVPPGWAIGLIGVGIWTWGLLRLSYGSYVEGGGLMLLGGFLLVLAVGEGWRSLSNAFLEWLSRWST